MRDPLPALVEEWARSEEAVVFSVVVSVALVALTVFAVPLLCARLPEDFLVRGAAPHSPLNRTVRFLVGIALIAVGAALLVLPGPGIVVILVGVSLLDFPGKQRIVRWIVRRPHVLASINRCRRARGRTPLLSADDDRGGGISA